VKATGEAPRRHHWTTVLLPQQVLLKKSLVAEVVSSGAIRANTVEIKPNRIPLLHLPLIIVKMRQELEAVGVAVGPIIIIRVIKAYLQSHPLSQKAMTMMTLLEAIENLKKSK
jgi:hypothetical protein